MRISIFFVLWTGFVQALWPNFPRFFSPSPSSTQVILEELRLLSTSVESLRKDTIDEISNVKDEIAIVKDGIANVNSEIANVKGEIASVKGEIANVKDEIANTKDGIANVNNRISRNEPLWQKAGATYEIAIRNTIRAMYGSQYTESSGSYQNIQQLTELCLPENFDVAAGKLNPRMQSFENSKQIQLGSEILAQIAFDELDGLQTWVDETTAKMPSFDKKNSEDLNKKLSLVQRELELFSRVNERDQLKYLIYSRLGFFALSRRFLSDPSISGYVRELEIDCRSPVTMEGDAVRIVFVEVKTGQDYKEALVQLIKRSGLVCMATQCILPHGHNFTFTTRCEIYSPSPWIIPPPELVSECKKEAGIASYPDNMYFALNKMP